MPPIHVTAFYKFARLPDPAGLREPLKALCLAQGIRGTILLAPEGVNGTIAGTEAGVAAVIAYLRSVHGFGDLACKNSAANAMPFRRMKVRLKKEIVTLGVAGVDVSAHTGAFVEPEDWNALIADPGVIVIDTRNSFEFRYGTFAGAVDPGTVSFRQFPDFIRERLGGDKHRTIAMFCTGGIRCEKATSHMLNLGFTDVRQLKGGILNYLERVPEADSRWQGHCFVFDEREALGQGLQLLEADGADA